MTTNKISILKIIIIPSLLVALVGVTACQNATPPTDTEQSVVVEDADAISAAPDTANIVDSEEALTADQQMIDNLSHYRWTLTSATDDTNQPISALTQIDQPVALAFNDRSKMTLNYSVGCNTISAPFQLKDTALMIENGMSTKMSCEDLNAAENLLNTLMQGESQLSLIDSENPVLTQTTANETILVWTGEMTAQAKYNTKGETIFWEVAAETQPCQNNATQLCLRVRPVTYDGQGLKSSEGEWMAFAGTIDGYEHDNSQNSVLRLQRFKTENDTVLVDNINSEYAYVLDTIIESSISNQAVTN